MQKPLTPWTPFRRMPQRTALAAALCIVSVVANLGLRALVGRLVDDGAAAMAQAIPWAALLAAAFLAVRFWLPYCQNAFRYALQASLSRQLMDKVLHGRQKELNSLHSADLATLYEADIQVIVRYADRILGRFVPDAVLWVLSAAMLFWVHPAVCAVGVLAAVVPTLLMTRLSKKISEKNTGYQSAQQAANRVLTQATDGIESIKTGRLEAVMAGRYHERLQTVQKSRREVAFWEAVVSAPTLVTAFITMFAIALVGGYLACSGQITAGDLVVCVTLTDSMVSPVMCLDGTLSALRRAQVSFARLNAFLTLPDETFLTPADTPEGGLWDGPIDSIVCRDVGFGYQAGQTVFSGLSFACQKGQLTLLSGENGAGKSTLTQGNL